MFLGDIEAEIQASDRGRSSHLNETSMTQISNTTRPKKKLFFAFLPNASITQNLNKIGDGDGLWPTDLIYISVYVCMYVCMHACLYAFMPLRRGPLN